jgi:hypothetical protein
MITKTSKLKGMLHAAMPVACHGCSSWGCCDLRYGPESGTSTPLSNHKTSKSTTRSPDGSWIMDHESWIIQSLQSITAVVLHGMLGAVSPVKALKPFKEALGGCDESANHPSSGKCVVQVLMGLKRQ